MAGDEHLRSSALGAALADVLARAEAQVARVVDGRTGAVVAQAGAVVPDGPATDAPPTVGPATDGPPTDGPDDVAALLRVLREAGAVAAAGGGLADVVLTTRRSVHVLREGTVPGAVLHVRLEHGRGDVGAARRALATSHLDAAVRAALELPSLPGPRTGDRPTHQPALATLAGGARPLPSGALAVLALGPLPALARRVPAPRASGPVEEPPPVVGGPAELHQDWSRDAPTLQRLLTGLRRRS